MKFNFAVLRFLHCIDDIFNIMYFQYYILTEMAIQVQSISFLMALKQ